MHDFVKVPMRKLVIRNLKSGSGTRLALELTDEDIKEMYDAFSLISVEIKEEN